jgi:hypothetical protein
VAAGGSIRSSKIKIKTSATLGSGAAQPSPGGRDPGVEVNGGVATGKDVEESDISIDTRGAPGRADEPKE